MVIRLLFRVAHDLFSRGLNWLTVTMMAKEFFGELALFCDGENETQWLTPLFCLLLFFVCQNRPENHDILVAMQTLSFTAWLP